MYQLIAMLGSSAYHPNSDDEVEVKLLNADWGECDEQNNSGNENDQDKGPTPRAAKVETFR